MYQVTVNIDPKLIGHGELLSIVHEAIKAHIIGRAKEIKDEPLIKVVYADDV